MRHRLGKMLNAEYAFAEREAYSSMSLIEKIVRGAANWVERSVRIAPTPGMPMPGVGHHVDPILIVTGYANDADIAQPWLRALLRDGFRARVIVMPRFGMGDNWKYAELLSQEVDRELAAGARRVHLVGWSHGGLVARGAEWLRNGHRVGRVVTVATANQGLRLPWIIDGWFANFAPEGMRQLHYGHAYIRTLLADSGRRDIVAVGTSRHDLVLTPVEHGPLPGKPFYVVDEGRSVNHAQLPADHLVYEAIRQALLTAPE